MQHYWSLEGVHLPAAWLTIGSFDGVHRGHQSIITRLVSGAHARGLPAVVLTFHPHPAVVLGKRQGAFYLTTPEERASLLGQLGVDVVITHPFNLEVAGTSAEDFMSAVSQALGLKHLLIGPDFALGHNRGGNAETLPGIGARLGFTVEVMPPLMNDGEQISSSLVRHALRAGNVEEAWRLLGRPYSLRGEVVHGDARGHDLGFPTANLDVWPERLLPAPGVYVCRASVSGRTWGAVTNVGFRPTFENQPATPRVEAYLLDFDENIYGLPMDLAFLRRLRPEERYETIQALIDQMHLDVQNGRRILAELESQA